MPTLSDEQKVFLVDLLQKFKDGCPDYANLTPDQQTMLAEIVVILALSKVL